VSSGTIRRTETRDVPAIAELHAALVPSSLWAELGLPFLTRLYASLVRDPRFVSFVYETPAGIGAFLAGSTDTKRMLRATAKRDGWALALRALPALRPSLVRRLLETGRYPRIRGSDGAGESLFCAVRPELRRQGIAAGLHEALERMLRAQGIDRLVVTTEATNPDAHEHLKALGFQEDGRFRFYGKEMLRYAKVLGST
jgi:ribosomal protein S18 acetylase RimI-like enzyme